MDTNELVNPVTNEIKRMYVPQQVCISIGCYLYEFHRNVKQKKSFRNVV